MTCCNHLYEFASHRSLLKDMISRGIEHFGEENIRIRRHEMETAAMFFRWKLMETKESNNTILDFLLKEQRKARISFYRSYISYLEMSAPSVKTHLKVYLDYHRINVETFNKLIEIQKKGELENYLQRHIDRHVQKIN